jgi:hypothetical protein
MAAHFRPVITALLLVGLIANLVTAAVLVLRAQELPPLYDLEGMSSPQNTSPQTPLRQQ